MKKNKKNDDLLRSVSGFLKVAHIRSKEDLMVVATEMRRAALDDPTKDPHKYCKTKKEFDGLMIDITSTKQEMLRFSRWIKFGPYDISITCTFDQFVEPHEWHVSMLSHVPNAETKTVYPVRVTNQICKAICEALMGKGYKEGKSPSIIIPNVRHFYKVAE